MLCWGPHAVESRSQMLDGRITAMIRAARDIPLLGKSIVPTLPNCKPVWTYRTGALNSRQT